MTKTWYPVIDYEKCTECGACNDQCTHGVYDESKYPSPAVVFPEGCIQGCHGCEKVCPSGAIGYVGDSGASGDDCGCGCDCNCGCSE